MVSNPTWGFPGREKPWCLDHNPCWQGMGMLHVIIRFPYSDTKLGALDPKKISKCVAVW